jgi:hypothetical protein
MGQIDSALSCIRHYPAQFNYAPVTGRCKRALASPGASSAGTITRKQSSFSAYGGPARSDRLGVFSIQIGGKPHRVNAPFDRDAAIRLFNTVVERGLSW